MSRKQIEEHDAPVPGKRAEKRPGPHDDQRDTRQEVQHMPRHWQAPGTRGETAGQDTPPPDEREVARGNQYGTAGQVASEQVHDDLTEHGRDAAPQHRDNEQLPKRRGEHAGNLPTPDQDKAK